MQLPSSPDEFVFEYHDLGYITLAPCTPYKRDIVTGYTRDSNVITNKAVNFTEEWVGKYILLNGRWVRVIHITDAGHAVINEYMGKTGTDTTMLVTMNQIAIEGEDVTLTKFELDYVPLVR